MSVDKFWLIGCFFYLHTIPLLRESECSLRISWCISRFLHDNHLSEEYIHFHIVCAWLMQGCTMCKSNLGSVGTRLTGLFCGKVSGGPLYSLSPLPHACWTELGRFLPRPSWRQFTHGHKTSGKKKLKVDGWTWSAASKDNEVQHCLESAGMFTRQGKKVIIEVWVFLCFSHSCFL